MAKKAPFKYREGSKAEEKRESPAEEKREMRKSGGKGYGKGGRIGRY